MKLSLLSDDVIVDGGSTRSGERSGDWNEDRNQCETIKQKCEGHATRRAYERERERERERSNIRAKHASLSDAMSSITTTTLCQNAPVFAN